MKEKQQKKEEHSVSCTHQDNDKDIYILFVRIKNSRLYFVSDLDFSLSRNFIDAFLFASKGAAEPFIGTIEEFWEKRLNGLSVSCKVVKATSLMNFMTLS